MRKHFLISVLLISFGSQQLLFSQSNTFPSDSNVGIGTLNPTFPLEIWGSSGIQLHINPTGNGTDGGIFFNARTDGGGQYNTAMILVDAAIAGTTPTINFDIVDGDGSGWNRTLTIKATPGNDASGNVGIGTTSPTTKLQVNGALTLEREADPYVFTSTSTVDQYRYVQFLNSVSYGSAAGIKAGGILVADHYDYASPQRNDLIVKGNVGIGTTTPDSKLTVKGIIHAEEVKVDLSVPGPDYVFDENYPLRLLTETKTYIDQHKHLPGIPSSEEMQQNGVNLLEMNMKLLEKVEELTLYLIEQEKKNQLQEDKIMALQKAVNQLKSSVE